MSLLVNRWWRLEYEDTSVWDGGQNCRDGDHTDADEDDDHTDDITKVMVMMMMVKMMVSPGQGRVGDRCGWEAEGYWGWSQRGEKSKDKQPSFLFRRHSILANWHFLIASNYLIFRWSAKRKSLLLESACLRMPRLTGGRPCRDKWTLNISLKVRDSSLNPIENEASL